MSINLQELLTRANAVRIATTEGENTAQRVGSLLVDIASAIDEMDDALKSELRPQLIELGSFVESVSGTHIDSTKIETANAKIRNALSATSIVANNVTIETITAAKITANSAQVDALTVRTSISSPEINSLKTKTDETATIASSGQKTANDALSLATTLNERVTELSGAVAGKADASQIADAVAKIGVLPFDGFITDVSEARYKPKGFIGFCIKEGLFVKSLGDGLIHTTFAPYNIGDTDINPNAVYRYEGYIYARSGVKNIKKYIDAEDMYAELESYSATRPATVVLSEEEYEALVASGGVVEGTLYMTYDGTV